jgi:hypothetical protein
VIESKQEMDKLDFRKDFQEFVTYLEKVAIIHNEHCHVVKHKKTGDSGMKNTGKSSDAGSRSSGHNSGGSHVEVAAISRLTVTELSPAMKVVGLDWHWKAAGPGAAALP